MNVDAALNYLDFVQARHGVWAARQQGLPPTEWTDDPILRSKKFTNVFRVLDPGSQFVLTDLLPDCEPRDFLWRCILYRLTNRPAAWVTLRAVRGYDYPLVEDPAEGLVDDFIYVRDTENQQLFSGAYVIMPRPGVAGVSKIREVVLLAHEAITASWPAFSAATTQRERFAALRAVPSMGNFLSMQVLTDYGYGFGPDRENEFVVAGPGALRGAKAVDSTRSATDVILWAQTVVHADLPDVEIMGRRPSLMDVQNTFCEFSKYVRYQARETPTERPYVPAHPGAQPAPVLPEHWRNP